MLYNKLDALMLYIVAKFHNFYSATYNYTLDFTAIMLLVLHYGLYNYIICPYHNFHKWLAIAIGTSI